MTVEMETNTAVDVQREITSVGPKYHWIIRDPMTGRTIAHGIKFHDSSAEAWEDFRYTIAWVSKDAGTRLESANSLLEMRAGIIDNLQKRCVKQQNRISGQHEEIKVLKEIILEREDEIRMAVEEAEA